MDTVDAPPGRGVTEEKEPEPMIAAVLRNPVLHTLALMGTVSVVSWGVDPRTQDSVSRFAAEMPLEEEWWTLVTANYAHLDTAHLFSNALIVVVAGAIVALWSSPIRFHLFFLVVGVGSTAGQLVAIDWFGLQQAWIVGSSGAAFGLVGYTAGGFLSALNTDGASRMGGAAVCLLIASVITIRFSASGSALISHFIGVVAGLAAGWYRLLHASRRG